MTSPNLAPGTLYLLLCSRPAGNYHWALTLALGNGTHHIYHVTDRTGAFVYENVLRGNLGQTMALVLAYPLGLAHEGEVGEVCGQKGLLVGEGVTCRVWVLRAVGKLGLARGGLWGKEGLEGKVVRLADAVKEEVERGARGYVVAVEEGE